MRQLLVPLLAVDVGRTMRVDASYQQGSMICDSATCVQTCSQQPHRARTVNKNIDKSYELNAVHTLWVQIQSR